MNEFCSPGVLGILYAEDFGEDPPPPAPGPEAWTEPAPPPITEADIAAARERAVAAAEAVWADGVEERRTQALEALAAGLAEARQEAQHQAEAVADGLVRTALAMLAGVLPELSRGHGDAEVAALLRHVLPVLAPATPVVVRVHGGLVAALRDELDRMGEDVAGAVEVRAANLPPGDTRLSWEGGSLHRDSAALCAAVTDGLAQLGLLPPCKVPAPHDLRSLALV